jgi:hypothetical protein
VGEPLPPSVAPQAHQSPGFSFHGLKKKKKKKPTTDLTLKKKANEWEGGKEIAAFWFYN